MRGICVVHGDTASTLLGALIARRAGWHVAHVESGLRAPRLLEPFPEELIRRIVPRLAHMVFPPDDASDTALRAMKISARIEPTNGNTIIERFLPDIMRKRSQLAATDLGTGPVLVQIHRTENLWPTRRVRRLERLLAQVSAHHPVRAILHPATRHRFERTGTVDRMHDCGIVVDDFVTWDASLEAVCRARFVITDGATRQEECAAYGVPTLLWRRSTERQDGIGDNVVLASDQSTIDRFLATFDILRRPPRQMSSQPSAHIVQVLRRMARYDT